MPQVTIIGAGPGGSVAAIALARRGWGVTILEQHRFPRDKVCGECLSALGLEVLDRLGLTRKLHELNPIPLHRAILHADGADSVHLPLPAQMLGISRHALDPFLLDEARKARAAVRQSARCESMERTDGHVMLRVRDLRSNIVDTITTDHVILADGKSALPDGPPPPTGDFGIKSHWVGVDGPRDAIELFGCQGCYGGLAAIEGGRWNAAFSVPAARLRQHGGDIDALFRKLLGENASLSRRLQSAQRIGPWLAAPLPRFAVRTNLPAGVVPVGNAAAALEPIGGEGMGLAMRSAELAAEALDHSATNSSPLSARMVTTSYRSLWRVRSAGCRAAARIVSSPCLAPAALPLAASNKGIATAMLRLLGKT